MADHALTTTQREPAVIVGTITAVAAAAVTAAVAFGLDLTDEQRTAILGLVAVLAPIVAAIVTRPRVTPNAKVVEYVNTSTQPDTVVAGQASPAPTGTVLSARTDLGL